MTEPTEPILVGWLNQIPHNRREKVARWWVEDVLKNRTYRSPRQRYQDEREPSTRIAVDEIDGLASESLRQVLKAQVHDIESKNGSITCAVATPDGTQLLDTYSVPSRLLGVQFTIHGVKELKVRE